MKSTAFGPAALMVPEITPRGATRSTRKLALTAVRLEVAATTDSMLTDSLNVTRIVFVAAGTPVVTGGDLTVCTTTDFRKNSTPVTRNVCGGGGVGVGEGVGVGVGDGVAVGVGVGGGVNV